MTHNHPPAPAVSPLPDENAFCRGLTAETLKTAHRDAQGHSVSQRFIDAFVRGEVTRGGMAEAGWFDIGRIEGDGPVIVRPIEQPREDRR